MSLKKARRATADGTAVADDSSSSDDSDVSETDPALQKFIDQQVTVDFEGRCPIDSDADGVRQLLSAMLPQSQIDCSAICDTIIGQNSVGCVLKQCEPEGPSGSDEDDVMEVDSDKEVFGVSTVLNLTHHRDKDWVKQLTGTVLQRCQSSDASSATQERFKSALASTTDAVGLLLNERFINIPMQIASPLLTTLRDEIAQAAAKRKPFRFDSYLLISKLHLVDPNQKKSKKKKSVDNGSGEIWTNGEEEIFQRYAECHFQFSVAAESKSTVGGGWSDDDATLIPHRRVMLIPAASLAQAIGEIQAEIESQL